MSSSVDQVTDAPNFDSQAMWSYARRMANSHETRQQSLEDAMEQQVAAAELLERSFPDHSGIKKIEQYVKANALEIERMRLLKIALSKLETEIMDTSSSVLMDMNPAVWKDALQNSVESLSKTAANSSAADQVVAEKVLEMQKRVWRINHKGKAFPGRTEGFDEDEDVVLMDDDEMIPEVCPISKMALKDPLVGMRQSIRCPTAGCRGNLSRNSFSADKQLERKNKQLQQERMRRSGAVSSSQMDFTQAN